MKHTAIHLSRVWLHFMRSAGHDLRPHHAERLLDLAEGENTISLRSEEAPNWDGETYASETWPADYNLEADEAPIVDRITVSALAAQRVVSPVDVAVTTACAVSVVTPWARCAVIA